MEVGEAEAVVALLNDMHESSVLLFPGIEEENFNILHMVSMGKK